jgi:hypothetical protein
LENNNGIGPIYPPSRKSMVSINDVKDLDEPSSKNKKNKSSHRSKSSRKSTKKRSITPNHNFGLHAQNSIDIDQFTPKPNQHFNNTNLYSKRIELVKRMNGPNAIPRCFTPSGFGPKYVIKNPQGFQMDQTIQKNPDLINQISDSYNFNQEKIHE